MYDDKIKFLNQYHECENDINTLESMDITYKIVNKIESLRTIQEHIMDSIFKLNDSDERNVLFRRFVLNQSQNQIASEMQYSTRNIRRIQSKAIEHLNIRKD